MALQIAVYESVSPERILADWSQVALNVEFATNTHGFSDLTAFIQLAPDAALWWFGRYGLPWIQVNSDTMIIWDGRLEDVRLMAGGIQIVALGAWSTFGDVPYVDTPASPTTTDAIVADVLATAIADNPALLSSDTYLIEAPGVNVYDEVFEDADMREVLTRMATLGDSETPPRQWEVGIWEYRRLHFRPRGSAGQTWYIDAVNPEIERSISQVWNSAYTRYNSGASVTGTSTDTRSVIQFGVTRRLAVSSETTDSTQAVRQRDAALADLSTPTPRASVPIELVYTAAGTISPKWMVRSGDTMVIRNLPPETSDLIDRIRTFRISETRYRPDGDVLTITPEAPLPSLDVLIARSLEVPA